MRNHLNYLNAKRHVPMKKIILNKYNVFITFILSILGLVTSCEIGKAMYGVPSATYKVLGKVTNEANIPIEGIRVVMFPDSTLTDPNGNYEVNIHKFPDSQSFPIKFIDIDGTTNGSYIQIDSTVNFVDPFFEDGSGWDSGVATEELNIKMKEE